MDKEAFETAKSQRMWAGVVALGCIWWGGLFWLGWAFVLWLIGMIGLAALWKTKDAFNRAFNVDPFTGEQRKKPPMPQRDGFPKARPRQPWTDPTIRKVYPDGDDGSEHVRREL